MRKFLFCLFFCVGLCTSITAQQLVLKKGTIVDSLKINDTISESFGLYLPKKFETNKKWPVVFLFDAKGKGKQVLLMFAQAAEKHGYILAASNSVYDSLPMSENILRSSRMMNTVLTLLPVDSRRIYTSGFAEGAKFASVLPVVIKNIEGVLSIGAPLANTDVLTVKNPFHYIGVVDVDDYNLIEMQVNEKLLNGLRFSNELFVYEQGSEPSPLKYIDTALEVFSLNAMAKGLVDKDTLFINTSFNENFNLITSLISQKKLLQADDLISDMMTIYRVHKDIGELKSLQKDLRKDKLYKTMKRSESNYIFKESFLREDYDYAIYEDLATYNFNNLGWWNYQMQELNKNSSSGNPFESQMGKRLIGFINHLVESNSNELKNEKVLDEEGLNFLWMLQTITNPKNYDSYIKVISYNSKKEDFGTALFYLEELLKAGYTDKKELYNIEHTALLRITPEFNQVVEKYLKDARYQIIEQ